jgi:DNA helicase-2/ATP-dependent DNA helicase PcrA
MIFLETLERHSVRVGSKQKPRFTSAVSLMTAHRSKGLEFDYVFIIGARDGHWGNKRSRDLFTLPIYGQDFLEVEDLEDERRLFYVALTRARLNVVVTWSEQGEDGKAYLPSVFVEEIDPTHVETLETAQFEKAYSRIPLALEVKKEAEHLSLRNTDYLRKVFLEEGLSVTALNNYLECPWKYFFTNLVRIPQTPEPHQLFGNAIHAALKEFYDALAHEKNPSSEDLTASFERNLMRQPLSEHEFRDSLKRGVEALQAYFKTYDGAWFKEVITEFAIAGVFIEILPGVNLLIKGRLDKIELLDGVNRVNVVDYKTGKPKSRNAILGDTKDSEGNIKRQLDFYKLLLDEYEMGKYEMVSGEIDFVEPAGKGLCKKERFEVTKEDAATVRKEVVRVGNEIYSFSFWDKKCDTKGCPWCELGSLVQTRPDNN